MNRSIIKKAFRRIFRIITFRKGIYGTVGHNNVFKNNVYIHEMSDIGSYNYFGNGTMLANASVGNYCSIAPGVKIGQAEHSVSYITTYNKISEKNIGYNMFLKKTVIGNDVWIGGNAVILQGVTVGNGAVIGAGAVVTKNVPNYAIAVGIPAKVIKYRFTEEKIQKLLESKWYEHDFKNALLLVKELERSIL